MTTPADKPTAADPGADDAAVAAAAAPDPAPTPDPAPEPASDDAAAAAFERGVGESKEADPAPKPEGEGEGDPPDPEGGDPEGDAAAAAAKGGKDGKPEGDPAVEDEIKALGITNERTQARFRELATRAAEAEPLRARAARADEWEATVLSTGADPEQFGAALGYLRGVCSGDPVQMRAAYDQIVEEAKTLGGLLGLPTFGVDPLDAHPDLKEKVRLADLDRESAEELARRRQADRIKEHATTTQTEQQRQGSERDAGIQAVAALGAELRAQDPAFAVKAPQLAALVNRIQATLPPREWAAAIKDAWAALPAPAKRPPPTAMPIRPSGSSSNKRPAPQNDGERFDLGVAAARASGQ